MKQLLKRIIKNTFFPFGSIRTVLRGPCRGLKIRIFRNFGVTYLYGGYEPREAKYMIRLLRPGMVSYDVGANFGMHTLLLSRLVGPSGKVYAFEPVPKTYQSLREHIELNGFGSTFLVQKAVADESGLTRFAWHDCQDSAHLATDGDIEVEITTLDHFVLDEGNPPPDFIKIDVEGAESRALVGARRVIQRYKPNLMIELHNAEQDRAVGKILQELNYVAFRTKDGTRLQNVQGCRQDPSAIEGTVVKVIALPAERERLLHPASD